MLKAEMAMIFLQGLLGYLAVLKFPLGITLNKHTTMNTYPFTNIYTHLYVYMQINTYQKKKEGSLHGVEANVQNIVRSNSNCAITYP